MNDIRAAWARRCQRFAGTAPPSVPTLYQRGYCDGRASVTDEAAGVLKEIDHLAEMWGDDPGFRAARDRLRALL